MSDILLLCDDLIFTSRVAATARAHGLALRSAKSSQELSIFCEQSAPACVIIDLNLPGLDIDQLAHALGQLQPRPTLVGYGSHVDAASLNQARAAGLDVVWPRSKFAEELETALPGWAVGPTR